MAAKRRKSRKKREVRTEIQAPITAPQSPHVFASYRSLVSNGLPTVLRRFSLPERSKGSLLRLLAAIPYSHCDSDTGEGAAGRRAR